MVLELLSEGISNGFFWFPFVLGVGLLYKNLKTIDVSIDGITIISIIVFVVTWNSTSSLLWSASATIICAIICYSILSVLIYEFKVNAIFAGIIFSLILYAASVVAIGESLSLNNQHNFAHLKLFSKFFPFLSLIVALGMDLLYRTKLGVSVRVIGENKKANTVHNKRLLLLFGFISTGILIGYGAIGYAVKENVARSGGGFDFLVNSLTSFLLVDKFVDYSIAKYKIKNEEKIVRHFFLFSLLQNPVVKAFLGSILFQVLVILIIAYTPNTIYWKLFFGIALILTVAKFNKNNTTKIIKVKNSLKQNINIENIHFSYDVGYENKVIFEDFSTQFSCGINIIRGANGIGKTTLLKLINNEINPAKGKIIINGKNNNIFYLRQEPIAIFGKEMTVFENVINVIPELKNHTISGVNKLISIVEKKIKSYELSFDFLNDKSIWVKTADSLSGGQLQKIACMMALVSESDIILADEPSSGLDENNVKTLKEYFYSLSQKGKIVIIISHDNRLFKWEAKHFLMTNNKLGEINDKEQQ